MNLTKFAVNAIQPYSNILIVGKRRVGKTTLAKHLVTELGKEAIIYSENKATKNEWTELRSVSEQELTALVKEREMMKQDQELFVVIDDYTQLNSPLVHQLLMKQRFLELSVICIAQYIGQVHSKCRYQFDYMFVYPGPSATGLVQFTKESDEAFENALRETCTFENKRSLLIECRSSKLYYYTTEKEEPLKRSTCQRIMAWFGF